MTNVQPRGSTLRWQYRTLRFETGRDFEESAEHDLDALGADGWEVAGFVRFEIGGRTATG